MNHNPTAFNEYIELASVEIIEASIAAEKFEILKTGCSTMSQAKRCIDLCKSESKDNHYSVHYSHAFELIDWFRRKKSEKLEDAVDRVRSYPKGGNKYFWYHCAQIAERIVYDALVEKVDGLQKIRKEEEEKQQFEDEQLRYRNKCYYLLRKLGLEMDYLDRGYCESFPYGPDGRVAIEKTHEYYDELVEVWGLNLDADMVWTGDYENRYKSHYEVLKQCDEVIKKAKAKRQEVTA